MCKFLLQRSCLIAMLYGSTGYATANFYQSIVNLPWVGSLSVGPVWANAGETQSFYLTPEIEKSYIPTKKTNSLAEGNVFLGLQKPLSPTLLGQLGIMVATTGNADLQGRIWDDADPQFDNYIYRYQVRNTRIAAKGILLLDRGYWAMPWVGVSLGVGFNYSHDFVNTPTIFQAVATPNFTNYTNTAFTYSINIGMQKVLNKHWQLGAGYEFADWGKSRLGRASGQSMHTGLTLEHLYTNGVLFNLTYLV